jgi:hypothetical protein
MRDSPRRGKGDGRRRAVMRFEEELLNGQQMLDLVKPLRVVRRCRQDRSELSVQVIGDGHDGCTPRVAGDDSLELAQCRRRGLPDLTGGLRCRRRRGVRGGASLAVRVATTTVQRCGTSHGQCADERDGRKCEQRPTRPRRLTSRLRLRYRLRVRLWAWPEAITECPHFVPVGRDDVSGNRRLVRVDSTRRCCKVGGQRQA